MHLYYLDHSEWKPIIVLKTLQIHKYGWWTQGSVQCSQICLLPMMKWLWYERWINYTHLFLHAVTLSDHLGADYPQSVKNFYAKGYVKKDRELPLCIKSKAIFTFACLSIVLPFTSLPLDYQICHSSSAQIAELDLVCSVLSNCFWPATYHDH